MFTVCNVDLYIDRYIKPTVNMIRKSLKNWNTCMQLALKKPYWFLIHLVSFASKQEMHLFYEYLCVLRGVIKYIWFW